MYYYLLRDINSKREKCVGNVVNFQLSCNYLWLIGAAAGYVRLMQRLDNNKEMTISCGPSFRCFGIQFIISLLVDLGSLRTLLPPGSSHRLNWIQLGYNQTTKGRSFNQFNSIQLTDSIPRLDQIQLIDFVLLKLGDLFIN